MHAEFWHQCWENDRLGFHQDAYHPWLDKYLKPLLNKHATSAVFVPLCGKSLDMRYIAAHNPVIGAELSDIACRDFFAEAGLFPEVSAEDELVRYQAEGVSLLQGDYFSLTAGHLASTRLVYDRAALIALPEALRARYAAHLRSLIPHGTLLLLALEYPQEEMSGPPFSVSQEEVERLYPWAEIQPLARREIEDKVFARRVFDKVSELVETAYLISW